MNKFELDPAPSDPNAWPADAKRRYFRVGDLVRTLDGHEWRVIQIYKTWADRADKVQRRNMYRLDVQLPGSPVCVFPGWQLELVERG